MIFNLNLLHLLLVLAAALSVRFARREIGGRSMSPSRLIMLPLLAIGMTFVFFLFFLSLHQPLWLFFGALLLGVATGVARGVTMTLRFDQMYRLVRPSRHLVLLWVTLGLAAAVGVEIIGTVIRVAPLKTLEEEARSREERKKALRRQEDLVVELLPVNYAVATDLAPRVKDVLSERGTVTTDIRTNTLLVRDITSNIARARSLVQHLDTITPQVLIESRIVQANTNFVR